MTEQRCVPLSAACRFCISHALVIFLYACIYLYFSLIIIMYIHVIGHVVQLVHLLGERGASSCLCACSCLACSVLHCFFLVGCLADGRPSLQPPNGLQLSSPPAVPLVVFSIRESAEIMLIWADSSPHSVGLLPQTYGSMWCCCHGWQLCFFWLSVQAMLLTP